MTRYRSFSKGFGSVCAALTVAAAILAGCAPDTDEIAREDGLGTTRAAAVHVTARLTDHEFITADGVTLPVRAWLPPGSDPGRVKAVILALHGVDDYSNAFSIPGELWAKNGIATYAYDQRGFGAAPGRYLWPGRAPLAADAALATHLLRRRYPGKPVYLLGES